MTETKRDPLVDGAGDALREGAGRFERLIESVRAHQVPLVREGAAEAAPNPLLPVGPEELWARNFQTEAIGPRPIDEPRRDRSFISASRLLPDVPVVPALRTEPVLERAEAPLGTRIGKVETRQRSSWLGRLFSGARTRPED